MNKKLHIGISLIKDLLSKINGKIIKNAFYGQMRLKSNTIVMFCEKNWVHVQWKANMAAKLWWFADGGPGSIIKIDGIMNPAGIFQPKTWFRLSHRWISWPDNNHKHPSKSTQKWFQDNKCFCLPPREYLCKQT